MESRNGLHFGRLPPYLEKLDLCRSDSLAYYGSELIMAVVTVQSCKTFCVSLISLNSKLECFSLRSLFSLMQ